MAVPCSAAAPGHLGLSLVDVANPRNAADVNHLGAVDRSYAILRLEVTNAHYAEFLNVCAATADPYGLYDRRMTTDPAGGILRTGSGASADPYQYHPRPGAADRPVNFVSYYDAVRFANWMTGARHPGTTEDGAYRITYGAADAGRVGARQGLSGYALPTEDEWYKAAHYDPLRGAAGGYRAVTAKSFYGMLDPLDRVDEWMQREHESLSVVRSSAFIPEIAGVSRRTLPLATASATIGFRLVHRANAYDQTIGNGNATFSDAQSFSDPVSGMPPEAHPRYPWEQPPGGGGGSSGAGGGDAPEYSPFTGTPVPPFGTTTPIPDPHGRKTPDAEEPGSDDPIEPVPEPATLLMLGFGVLLVHPRRMRRVPKHRAHAAA